ncbi:PHP domain-containing protein [Streptomyces sp. NPDC006335]|uniref:PHP domain-containing protein n=1 Tax=Streptomyces sp. NPDC006335 TaxID=3156895 RepID=UPI0033BF0A11
MRSSGFTHLPVASGYSARYGASLPGALVQRAAERGVTTLALTDQDTVAGTVRFATADAVTGVHPVFDVDVAVAPSTHPTRSPDRGEVRQSAAPSVDTVDVGLDPRGATGSAPGRPRHINLLVTPQSRVARLLANPVAASFRPHGGITAICHDVGRVLATRDAHSRTAHHQKGTKPRRSTTIPAR